MTDGRTLTGGEGREGATRPGSQSFRRLLLRVDKKGRGAHGCGRRDRSRLRSAWSTASGNYGCRPRRDYGRGARRQPSSSVMTKGRQSDFSPNRRRINEAAFRRAWTLGISAGERCESTSDGEGPFALRSCVSCSTRQRSNGSGALTGPRTGPQKPNRPCSRAFRTV